MISKVLVAVDDSPAGMRAVAVGCELGARLGCSVRLLTVFRDGRVTAAVGRVTGEGDVSTRRLGAADSVLTHAARLAARLGVAAETYERFGEPGPTLLAEAQSWSADLVVLGRAAQHRPGGSYVGEVASHVLEFAEIPVLLVP